MSVKELLKQISNATSAKEVKDAIVIAASKAARAGTMGIEKKAGESVNAARKKANAAAMEVLERVGDDHTKLTEADKDALRKYSGIGGTDTTKESGSSNGHMHEYYTPAPIAAGIWDGLKAMGFGGGNTLEPSAGAGVFQETKPRSVIVTATEIDKTSSHVNKLLHPEDLVLNQPFEALASAHEDNSFDSCVGNVPFAPTRGKGLKLDPDPATKDIKSLHGYFVLRTIDKVKPNGLIGLVVPNGIVSGDYKKIRQRLSLKAEFLGAHRLPSGVFTNSGTSTSTDIIFLRKHSEELAEQISNLSSNDLKEANVIWKPFIDGKWFTTPEGKRFIHGEEEKGFRTTVKNTGELTNEALKKKLSHKFESRIDLDFLNLAEPLPIVYIEGDEKIINDRPMRFNGDTWELIKPKSYDGTLDANLYGAASTQEIRQLLTPITNASVFSYDQLLAISKDMPNLITGELKTYMELAASQDAKYREQIVRGCLIGLQIQELRDSNITKGERVTHIAKLVQAEIDKYGVAANISKLKSLSGKGALAWNSFTSGMDKDGKLSDFLNGKLNIGNVKDIDRTNASELISYLFSVKDLSPVPMDDFLEMYEGTDITLEQLAKYNDIAITPDGDLAPLDRATSGNIVETKNKLLLAMGSEKNTALLENMQRQIDEIERKRIITPVDAIGITMNAKWVPRDLVTEFLEENGYEFTYSKVETDENGDVFENTSYTGSFGQFLGYCKHDGLGRKGKSNAPFECQLENYLNDRPVRSSAGSGLSKYDINPKDGMNLPQRVNMYKSRIKQLEADFARWIRQHPRIDEVTDIYNDTFNGHINVEHSDKPLGLENTSGNIVNFGYQCSEIRRLSEAGTGICGFGTGLGKTSTALGLVAYNTQTERSNRTVLVVPKSVLENWYHESNDFFSEGMFKQSLFVGFKPLLDENGEIQKEAMMDGDKPKLNPLTNKPVYRTKLEEMSSAENTAALNSIPHSNYKFVVMSKEQFKKIPLRPESIVEHVDKMVEMNLLNGKDNKYAEIVKNHKDSTKNARFEEKYSDDGGAKAEEIAYFEDMGFDNIIADEGHNYRNSYSAGREASMIQYLPTSPSSQTALDMAVKSQYLKRKYNGRGTVLLTATPTVNSPTDIFNMLSHIMTPDDWAQYGIVDVDDFVRVFGETAPEEVEKLSGEIETKEALIGFKNLSGLRSIFHKYVNLKDATQIKTTVSIPDIIEVTSECEMSDEQSEIYESLRERAEALSSQTPEEAMAIEAMGGKPDTTFGIIRDMDRVTTDMDLYKRQITFVLPIEEREKIDALVNDLPELITVKESVIDPYTGKTEKTDTHYRHNAATSVKGEAYVLVVHEKFEDDVTSRLSAFGIDENKVSHPITPKYAKLIDNVKKGLETGKQIIFTEEKSQHEKLKRILANSLGLDPSVIGIINASAIAKKAPKPKKAKKGKEVDIDVDAMEAAEQGTLEEIAVNYNSGKLQILICNKKAEVGINLHIGTATVHHLTLPWTPASIKQRNGRGARVGAKQKSIDAIYYVGKGSFDEFRLNSLKRKANWMDQLFNGTDDYMANADASDRDDTSMLLAKNPEEKAAIKAAKEKAKAEAFAAAMLERSQIDLSKFISASHDLNLNIDDVKAELAEANNRITNFEATVKSTAEKLSDAEAEFTAKYSGINIKELDRGDKNKYNADKQLVTFARKQAGEARTGLQTAKRDAKNAQVKFSRITDAERKVKQLRSPIEAAIKNGLLDIDMDVLTNATSYALYKGKAYKVGMIFDGLSSEHFPKLVQIESVDFDAKTVTAKVVFTVYGNLGEIVKDVPLGDLGREQSYTPSELETMYTIRHSQDVKSIANTLTKEQFYHHLGNGTLKLSGDEYLVNDGDNFKIFSHREFATSGLDTGDIVYPTSKDDSLQKRLGKWMLENRDELKSYLTRAQFFEGIMGSQWATAYEQYGNVAPDSFINSWAMQHLKAWRESTEGQQIEAINLSSDKEVNASVDTEGCGNYIMDNYPTEYSNRSAFRKAAVDAVQVFRDDIRAKRKHRDEIAVLPLQAAFKIANVDKAAQLERIDWLKDRIETMGVRRLIAEAHDHALYAAYDKPVGAMLADLCKLVLTPMDVSGLIIGGRNTVNSFEYFIEKKADLYYDNMELFNLPDSDDKIERIEALSDEQKRRAIEERDRLKREAEAEQARLEKEAKEAAEIAKGTITSGSITIAVNRNAVYAQRKRFEAGEAYVLHDTDAKAGRLFQVKDILKSSYNAKYLCNNKDTTAEFVGSFWVIYKNSIELSKLTELLGMK